MDSLDLELRRAAASACVLGLNADQLTVVESVIEGVADVEDPTLLAAIRCLVLEDIQTITHQLDGTFLGVLSGVLARLDQLP